MMQIQQKQFFEKSEKILIGNGLICGVETQETMSVILKSESRL